MKRHDCCGRDGDPGDTTRRRAAGLAGVVLSGIPLVLVPKCPLCVASWITLLTGMGVTATTAGHLRTGIIALCLVVSCLSVALLVGKNRRLARK